MSPPQTPLTEALDTSLPCWDGYRSLLPALAGAEWPTPARLGQALPPGALSGGGHPLCFVAAGELPGVAYEQHIFETGEVPTRARDWHDLFNAMAWCRWPRLKAALNAAHYRHLGEAGEGRRGPRRDALTLLDESGALVASHDPGLLDALARRDWAEAFLRRREAWGSGARVLLCGHALLDKCRAPYRAMTAQALLLRLPPEAPLAGDGLFSWLDRALAAGLDADSLCRSPADLSPLPLAGVPGWWREPQDAGFYADSQVFRPPSAALQPAPVHAPEPPDRGAILE